MPTERVPDDVSDDLAALLTKTSAPAAAPRSLVGAAALVGFAGGVLCGIVGTLLVATLVAAPPHVHSPDPIPAVQARVEVAPTPVAPSPRMVVKVTRAPVTPAIPATPVRGSRATERATERAWLDAAHTALSRDDVDQARRHLEKAGARFPDGVLREEREALAIHVLLARGDAELAELATETFRTRHPGSPFVVAIEEAMRETEAAR